MVAQILLKARSWLLRHPEAMRAERKSRIPEYCPPPFVFRTETGQNDQNPGRQKHHPIVARTSEWSIHGNEVIEIREAKKFVAVQSVLAAKLSEIVDLVVMVAISMRTTVWDEGTLCERHDAAMDVARPDAASFATIASAYKWNLGKNTDKSWQAAHHGST